MESITVDVFINTRQTFRSTKNHTALVCQCGCRVALFGLCSRINSSPSVETIGVIAHRADAGARTIDVVVSETHTHTTHNNAAVTAWDVTMLLLHTQRNVHRNSYGRTSRETPAACRRWDQSGTFAIYYTIV